MADRNNIVGQPLFQRELHLMPVGLLGLGLGIPV